MAKTKTRKDISPDKVYVFGCLKPSNNDMMEAHLSEYHRFYNELITIERDRLNTFWELRAKHFPKLGKLEAKERSLNEEIEEVRKEIRKKRQQTRTRQTDISEELAKIKRIKSELKLIKGALKPFRKEVNEKLRVYDNMLNKRVEDEMGRLGKAGPSVKGRVRDEIRAEMVDDKSLPKYWRDITANEGNAVSRIKALRASTTLLYGTYNIVTDSVIQACKRTFGLPKHRRYDGTGLIGVQFQGCASIDDIYGDKGTLLQIDPLPENQWDTRSGRRHAHTKVRIRVGTDENRKPIWAEFPLLLDRPLPKDMKASKAALVVSRIGLRKIYKLQITMQSAEFLPKAPTGKGTAAIVLTWAKDEEKVNDSEIKTSSYRVAYLVPDNNRKKYVIPELLANFVKPAEKGGLNIVLPYEKFMGADELVRYLKRINNNLFEGFGKNNQKDYTFEGVRTKFAEWVRANKSLVSKSVRETFKDKEGKLPITKIPGDVLHWRNRGRLARIVRIMGEETFGDELQTLVTKWNKAKLAKQLDLFDPLNNKNLEAEIAKFLKTDDTMKNFVFYMELWRRKEAHLFKWEADERAAIARRRKQVYRLFGKWLRTQFATVVWSDVDLRELGRSANEEEDENSSSSIRHMRKLLAPGELRDTVKQYMGADNSITVSLPKKSVEADSKTEKHRQQASLLLEEYFNAA